MAQRLSGSASGTTTPSGTDRHGPAPIEAPTQLGRQKDHTLRAPASELAANDGRQPAHGGRATPLPVIEREAYRSRMRCRLLGPLEVMRDGDDRMAPNEGRVKATW